MRWSASGHSKGGTLPQNVGLMKSADGGQTWEAISGIGEIDYHDIEVHGTDHGRRAAHGRPELGPALHGRRQDVRGTGRARPRAPRSTSRSTRTTRSSGPSAPTRARSSRPTRATPGASATRRPRAKLAWAGPGKLYSAGLDGKIRLSTDDGKTWDEVGGTIGAGPKDFVAAPDGTLYAYLTGGKVSTSADGGKTWSELTALR